MKRLKVYFLGGLLCLSSCGEEERHIEKEESDTSAVSTSKENTSICKADWEGHGELVFPGLVTIEECESYCESIYEQLSADGRQGYCQYGAERLWELPFYQE